MPRMFRAKRSFKVERGFPYDQYVWVYSRGYSFAMRVLHAFGGHWRKTTGPNREIRWCHWCGDRTVVSP